MAAGCASTGSLLPQSKEQRAEIDELKQRVLELQKKVTVHELELARLQEQVAKRERQSRQAPPPPPPPVVEPEPAPTSAYQPPVIDESDLEAVGFRGENEDTGADPGFEAAPTEVAETEVPSERFVPPTPVAQNAEAPAARPEGVSVSAAAQVLYDEGYTLYHQGRFLDAEAAFRRFLQAHGETSLADNAQYWIGEARFARKDFKGSLAAFRETVENYPRGNKVPDALLKAGQSFERLGDLEAARDTYREVIRRFPESVAAVTAEERRALLP